MAEVPVRLTPWTVPELLAAYAEAWHEVIGGHPSRAALAILAGQATLECGHGGRPGCFNHNVGNVMALAGYAGDFHVLRAPECFPEGKVPAGWREQPSSVACGPGKVSAVPIAGSRFRAYTSFAAGCADKLRVLDRQWGRSIVALQAATGVESTEAFVAGLLAPKRYFSANAPSYTNRVLSLAQGIMRAAGEADWPAEPTPTLPAPPPVPVEVPNAADFVATLATDDEERA